MTKKEPFDEWFKEETKKIKIGILDPGITNEIISAYPNVWRVKQMRR